MFPEIVPGLRIPWLRIIVRRIVTLKILYNIRELVSNFKNLIIAREISIEFFFSILDTQISKDRIFLLNS